MNDPATAAPSAGASPPSPNYLPSHEIRVDRLEVSLLWPILIQARKNELGEYAPADRKLDPDQPGFLREWVGTIKSDPTTGNWQQLPDGYPPRAGSLDAARAYSEFCYFHPFVRNFLYVTRDDIRAFEREKRRNREPVSPEELVKVAWNRNMQILERKNAQGGTLSVEYDMSPNPGVPKRTYKSGFTIQSCWMYLFDTQIALVELQMQHLQTEIKEINSDNYSSNALSLRHVLHLQDIIRRVYAPIGVCM